MQTGSLHVGTRETCKTYLCGIATSYVYILRRPDGRPFYVGKGGGGQNKYRVLDHENEARHPNDWKSNAYKLNIIRLLQRSNEKVIYEIDSIYDNEMDAYGREAFLISQIRRLHEGGPLTNLSPGGGSESGASPISKEKHSTTLGGIPDDNPERATINGFVLSIYPDYAKDLGSIPIKPLSQFIPKATRINRTPKTKNIHARQACVLVASAAANGIPMDDACILPRLMTVQGVVAIIENGVACRILVNELVSIITAPNPRDEAFQLSKEQARKAVGLVGIRKCVDLGVISSALLTFQE